ncbi:histidine phosphatase family protein [Polynucleobacter sp. 71A-WALBACH]|uniref:histidine phosphatase family protein n=1 Tax=Polynucleobacter sp. 71A-WALBACH TaxID=2689097 RepID=UPI00351CE5CA
MPRKICSMYCSHWIKKTRAHLLATPVSVCLGRPNIVMKLRPSFFLVIFLLLFCQGKFALAQSELASKLNDGMHVLLMRHADAPGYGDPQNYQISQCSTQRNLGDSGRKQAKRIGEWLANQEIQQAKIYSSPWCRCVDTATLLNRGGG